MILSGVDRQSRRFAVFEHDGADPPVLAFQPFDLRLEPQVDPVRAVLVLVELAERLAGHSREHPGQGFDHGDLAPELPETQLAQGGYQYRVLRNYDAAAKAFGAAVKEWPNNNFALQSLGLVERRQGHWDRALVHLEQAASLDPRNAGLMVVIGGETYSNLRRFDEARQWLDRALALEPNDVMATFYKTFSYMQEDRLDDAERVLEPAVQKADVDPTLSVLHVYLRLVQHRDEDAITEAKALLARSDDALEGWRTRTAVYLGLAERRAGRADAARKTFADAAAHVESLKDHVDDTAVPADLAFAYAGAGRNEDARKQAQRAVELYSNDAIFRPWAERTQILVAAMAASRASASSVKKTRACCRSSTHAPVLLR